MTSYWAKKKNHLIPLPREDSLYVASTYLPIYKTDANYLKTTTLSLQQGIYFFIT